MNYELVKPSHPALHQPALRVVDYNDELAQVIAGLYGVLDATPGAAAVAAPQVGVSLRVFVYSFDGLRGCMVNPSITSHSQNGRAVVEGCLTYPGKLWKVKRWIRCQTAAFDRWGHVSVKDWAFFSAQVMQHEIEHLDGILLPDVAIRQVDQRKA